MFELRFYRRDGTEIHDFMEFMLLFADREYCRVASTTLANGTEVSTVWLGQVLVWRGGPSAIFETMVFSKDGAVLDKRRYSTEAEALDGHKATVQKWLANLN